MTLFRRLFKLSAALAAMLLAQPTLAQGSPGVPPERQILVMVRHPPDHLQPNGAYGGGPYGDSLGESARERLARSIARDHRLTFLDGWPMPMIGVDCFIMAVPDSRSTTAAARELSMDSKVAWAEPVELYQAKGASAVPNDPLFPAQPAAQQWQLADLHRIATGRGVKVAVIDSGIDARHPDLAGQLIVNRNFVVGQSEVAEDHGTGVAGIIAAKSDNGIGISGIAPEARLLGLRACWQQRPSGPTLCDGLSLAKALYFAVEQRSDVINLSLSGPDGRLLRTLINSALGRGAVVVAAYDSGKPDGGFPASVPGVIAVSDHAFAAAGAPVYIAPGRDVPTTQPGGRWFLVNGSSFSAAHVSGLAALVRQRRRSARLTLVSERRPPGTIVDACATLELAAMGCDCSCGGGNPEKARSAR